MPQAPAMVDELERQSAALDRLIGDLRCGRPPSQTRHDGHVDQARAIAQAIDAATRGPGRPLHAPIGRIGASLVW